MITFPTSLYAGGDSGGGGYTPPQTDLVSDWNPVAATLQNSSSGAIADGEVVSRWDDSKTGSSLYMDQGSNAAMPEWFESDSNRNNKPYIRFNRNASGSSSGVTWLQTSSQFAYDDSRMTFYLVIDYDSNTESYTDVFTNTIDSGWDEGFSIHSQSSGSIHGSVASWASNDVTIKSSFSSPRVIVYKFRTGTTPYSNRGGYTFGSSVTWNSDSSTTNMNQPRQNLGSNYSRALLGTGRNGSGNLPYYGMGFNLYRMLIYDENHTDAESEAIMADLKAEYNTL